MSKPRIKIKNNQGEFVAVTTFETTRFEKSYNITDLQEFGRFGQTAVSTITLPYKCNAQALVGLVRTEVEINTQGYPERFTAVVGNSKKGDKIQLKIISEEVDLLEMMKNILVRDVIDTEQMPLSLPDLRAIWPDHIHDGTRQAYYGLHHDKKGIWYKDLDYGYWESAGRPLLFVAPLLEKAFCQLGYKLNAPLYNTEYGRRQVLSALNSDFYEDEIQPYEAEYLNIGNFLSEPVGSLNVFFWNTQVQDDSGAYDPNTGFFTAQAKGTYYIRLKLDKAPSTIDPADIAVNFDAFPTENFIFDDQSIEVEFIRQFDVGERFVLQLRADPNDPPIIASAEMEFKPLLLDLPLKNYISKTKTMYDILVGERGLYGFKMTLEGRCASLLHDIGDGTFTPQGEPIEAYWRGCAELDKVICNSEETVRKGNEIKSQQFKLQNDSACFSDGLEQGREVIIDENLSDVKEYRNDVYLQTFIGRNPKGGSLRTYEISGGGGGFGAPYQGGCHRMMTYTFGTQMPLNGDPSALIQIRITEDDSLVISQTPNVFPVMPDLYIDAATGYDYGEENVVYGSQYRTRHLYEVFHQQLFLDARKTTIKLEQAGKDCAFNSLDVRALQLVRLDGILQKFRVATAKRVLCSGVTKYELIPYSPVRPCVGCEVSMTIEKDFESLGFFFDIAFWPIVTDEIEVLEHWILDQATGTLTQSFVSSALWPYAVGSSKLFTHFWKLRVCDNDCTWLSFDVNANYP